MASVKKGFLAQACQWAKHQRPYWSRQFWKRERRAGQQEAFDEAERVRFGDYEDLTASEYEPG